MYGITLTVSDAYIVSLTVSGVLFVTHKIEGRFRGWGRPDPEQTPAWHAEWPWLIVSHAPFGAWSRAAATIAVYVFILGGCVALMGGIAKAIATASAPSQVWGRAAILATFTILWLAWHQFELHHLRGAVQRRMVTRGLVFSLVSLVWAYLVYLPMTVLLFVVWLSGPSSG